MRKSDGRYKKAGIFLFILFLTVAVCAGGWAEEGDKDGDTTGVTAAAAVADPGTPVPAEETQAVVKEEEPAGTASAGPGEAVETKDKAVTENERAAAQPALSGLTPSSPLKDFVTKAWELSSQGKLEELDQLVSFALSLFEAEAKKENAQLSSFPPRGKESDYQTLNDIGTLLFIKAEALMNYGKTDDSIKIFQYAIDNYKWAQAWDPSRGALWSVAEKSQASIDVMTGNVQEEVEVAPKEKIYPTMKFPGTEKVVDYRKYGEFVGVGTTQYHYKINDPQGLSQAVGEGIYPNTSGVLKDPDYKKLKDEGRLEGNHWDFVHSDDLQAAFYKWTMAPEPAGVKLFYLGTILEEARMYNEAIKAYQALIVHFPQTIAWTYWQTPWYPAQAAVAKIKYLVKIHPELRLKAQWMNIKVKNGFDNDVTNDEVVTYPGRIRERTFIDQLREWMHLDQKTVPLNKIVKRRGTGKVQLVQYDNGHWQMLVEGKPYVIKGMTYAPTKIGQSPDKGTLVSWMYEDSNHNGKADGPFDSWVDGNHNNQQDPDEPVVGDFRLMKEMGVNTMREYQQPFKPNKEVLRSLYKDYGIRVIMGDFLGKYTLGSGATWFEGTDYENPEHRKNMMESVRQMVLEHKDEPYLLMWLLGNENNYGVASNADKKPAAYFEFANEVAKMIKSIDPDHPVAICNGDTLFLDLYAQNAPDVDVFSSNAYRGNYGFGAFWQQVRESTDRPVFITEYGCPAFSADMTREQAEKAQAEYHQGNWLDIASNMAGQAEGAGNSLGGVVFEWTDEWWKNYDAFYHDRKSDAIGPFPGGYYYEEWFGVTSQGNGSHSPFMRQLRQSYEYYRKTWNEEKDGLLSFSR